MPALDLDFSSAFNSMKTHILLKRLINLGVDDGLTLWIKGFLSFRPQRVHVNGTMSDLLTVSTGCSQGCVLSPVLFSLFTNDFMINEQRFSLFKYAPPPLLWIFFFDTQKTKLASCLASLFSTDGRVAQMPYFLSTCIIATIHQFTVYIKLNVIPRFINPCRTMWLTL
ncbi:hypothetical protein LDENG_00144230 [Lucifuga dentata]|nr:hypothetical protein LDENG_00144230 [Lucifuga dentata]